MGVNIEAQLARFATLADEVANCGGIVLAEIIRPGAVGWPVAQLVCLHNYAACAGCGYKPCWPGAVLLLHAKRNATVTLPIPFCEDCASPRTVRAGCLRVFADLFPQPGYVLRIDEVRWGLVHEEGVQP